MLSIGKAITIHIQVVGVIHRANSTLWLTQYNISSTFPNNSISSDLVQAMISGKTTKFSNALNRNLKISNTQDNKILKTKLI